MITSSFGLYLHIPFCSRKCPYCDFNTYAVSHLPEVEYVSALKAELSFFKESPYFSGGKIHSIFFGGGTPSLLSPKSIETLLTSAAEAFEILPGAEVTLEANPAAAHELLYSDFRSAGINRLSLGGQSLSAETLRFLGREHTPDQIIGAIDSAQKAGIENISLDVIFGVPHQTKEQIIRDLDLIANFPIKHISTYSLTIEKGTPFYQRQERGLLTMPTDDTVADMMDGITQHLADHNFCRYEISNYSLDGYHSRHNTAYWEGKSYLGLGAGAHSFARSRDQVSPTVRWSNCALPNDYIKRISTGSVESWREVLTPTMLQFEFFFLGLRKIAGVSLSEFTNQFGESALQSYETLIQELVKEGFLIQNGDVVALSPRGIHVADSVVERLLPG
jgi:oxygen-independent coproporphyrinogen-3 oxidase